MWKIFVTYLVLSISAITDVTKKEITNELIVIASIVSTLCVGGGFIIRFILALSIALFLKGKGLGSGDKKLIAWLFGTFGFSETYLFGLLLSFILFILFNLSQKDKKKEHPLSPYLLGGFLCVELLPF